MKESIVRLASASPAVIGVALAVGAVPAAAQSGDESAPATQSEAPATDAPADAASDASGLGEIIVTAQRRSENLQRVPVTVSAINSQSLTSANIMSGTELGKVVPALTIQPNSSSVLLFLRGIGSNVSAVGSEASVAFYVDGVYYSRLFPGLVRLNNIERVEVLKGPQGTLYGRNSSGGLVNVITRDPEPGAPTTGEVSFGYGNYETIDATGYVAYNLADNLAIDVAGVVHHQNKGFGTNLGTGEDVVKSSTRGIRSKLVYEPGPDTVIKLTGEYVTDKGDFAQSTHFRHNRQGFIDGSGALPTLGFFDTNKDYTNANTSREYGASLRIQQDVGFANITNTIAYHDIKQLNEFDADLSPKTLQHTSLFSYGKELINDFQIASKGGSATDWTFGVFYTDQKQGYNPAYIGLGDTASLEIFSNSRVRSIAGYGEARFPIVGGLKGTVGFRYTRDRLTGNGRVNLVAPDQLPSPAGPVLVPDLLPAASAGYTFTKATFKLVLDYQFTPDVFGYASFSRGYKGATFNMIPFDVTPTKPELLDAYEAGLKTELFDRHVRINLAGFHYELKNPQVIIIPDSGTISTENAGAAEIDGAEIELTLVPVTGLNLRASGIYLDARYTDYKNAPLYVANPNFPFGNLSPTSGSADGNMLPYAPKWAFNAGGDYTFDVGGGSVTLGGNVAFASRTFFQPDNRLFQGSQAIVDAYLEYKFGESGLSLKAYGQNLTNRHFYTGAVEFGNAAGDLGFPAAPRTYGMTLRYKY